MTVVLFYRALMRIRALDGWALMRTFRYLDRLREAAHLTPVEAVTRKPQPAFTVNPVTTSSVTPGTTIQVTRQC